MNEFIVDDDIEIKKDFSPLEKVQRKAFQSVI